MRVKVKLFGEKRFFNSFRWSVVSIVSYLSLKLLGIVFLVPIVALAIMFFSSTLLLSFIKRKQNLVSVLVLSMGISMLFKTLVLFLLLSNRVINYDWKLWLAMEVVLLIITRPSLVLFKKKPEIEIETMEGDVLAIVVTGILFVVLIINTSRCFLIPSADPYGFKNITDYIYYLGVLIPFFSLIGLFKMVRGWKIRLLKKYLSFGVMAFLSIVVNEFFPRLGVTIVNERFMMFLGLALVPIAVMV